MKKLNLIFLFSVLILNTSAQWMPTNGPYGGTVTCFAISGQNIFAGTDGGGVFLSTDSGTTWTPVNKGITNPRITALTISGTTVFAGASYGYDGLFRSTDNGKNWTIMNNGVPDLTWISALAVSGTNI